MVNGSMHALKTLTRVILHLIANNKYYKHFFLHFLLIKKWGGGEERENDNSFLPFLPVGHIQLKEQSKIKSLLYCS